MFENDLKALMAAEPSADPVFILGVMARIERRQFHRALLERCGLALAASLLLALVMPVLENVWQTNFSSGIANLAAGLLLMSVTLAANWWMAQRD